jgi:NADH-quinone oxidoreductase subunit C
MTIDDVFNAITNQIGENIICATQITALQNTIEIKPENLIIVCEVLQSLYFDQLACITGLDFPKENRMEVVYNFYAITQNIGIAIKVNLERNKNNNLPNTEKQSSFLPNIPTISHLWRTANWHEREIYDLFGITFDNHPDLRRILLPADWEGHPLRKDYQHQEKYHGIGIKYE